MPEISSTSSFIHKPKNVLPKATNSPVEIEQHRTSHSRTYINPDGTFTVETSYRPIHFKNNRGKWSEIDNQLVTANTPGYSYKNKSNSFDVMFANNNQSGNFIRLDIDSDHWIAFTPADKFSTPGKSNKNTMQYKNIKSGVDVNYDVDSNRLKETIILSSYPGNNTFAFPMLSKGLTYEKDDAGGIWFKDDKTGEPCLYFTKPYAEDANDIISENVSLDIKRTQGTEKIIITLDNAWLQKAKYPVIIEPSIDVQPGPSESQDTFVSSTNPATYYYNSMYLNVGQHATYGDTMSYIKFKYLPTLPPSVSIIDAFLGAYMYLAVSPDGTIIEAHQITSDWQSSTTSYNDKPTYNSTVLDSINDTQNNEWQFEITSLVNDWYSGTTPNYGVMLKAQDNSMPRRAFLSGDATNSQPRLIINYQVDPLGLESFWGYSGNVNIHNGNLVVTDTDVSLSGKGIPITVTRTHNSRSFSPNSFLSYGWSSNVDMHLNYSDGSVITFTNGDGNKYCFTKKSDGSYTSPPGIELTLTHIGGTYQLHEKSGLTYNFNNVGKLDNITDTNNNQTTLSYNADGTLHQVTDASDRHITFSYSSGRLYTIAGAQIPTVAYGYDASGNLNSVVKYDPQWNVLDQVSYGYDNYHNIITITDGENNTTTMSYYAEDRVYTISKQLTMNGQLNTLTTTYTYQSGADNGMITTVQDPTTNQTKTQYTTNGYGNVKQVIRDFGTGKKNITTYFSWDGNSNMVQTTDPKTNSYGADYDDNGNIMLISSPDLNKASYKYNSNNDMIQSKDFASRQSQNIYDSINRDYIVSTNKLFTSSVYRHADEGNIVSETIRIGIGQNLLKNTGFEDWNGNIPDKWQQNGSGGTINFNSSFHINGLYSVQLTSTGSTDTTRARLITADYISVTPKAFYNLSWYLKTQAVGSTNGGATGSVHWYDISHNLVSSTLNIAPAIGDSDWIRKGARIAAPENAIYAKVEISVNDSGTAWFDNIQMIYGTIANDYNLLENESFEYYSGTDGTPDNWISSGFTGSDGITTTYARTGTRSVLLNGATSTNKYFYYPVKIEGEAGTPLHFSGWSKAQGISPSGGDYSIVLHVVYLDSYGQEAYERYEAVFSKSDHDWEYTELTQSVQNDFIRIEMFGKLENQTGSAWFDDFNLRLDGAPDALLSHYNIAENSGFEYANSSGTFADKWQTYNSTTPGTYDISWVSSTDTLHAYSGNKMIRISNVPDWATVGNQVTEPLKTATTYSASAVIKTLNVTGSGAVLKFDILDSSNAYLTQKLSRVLIGTYDWTWVTVSLTDSQAKALHPDAAKIRVTVGTIGASGGIMYFDSVRLQERSIRTLYTFTSDGNYTTSITNTLLNTVYLTPDDRGNVLTAVDPYSNTANFTYDLLDQTKSAENEVGLLTEYIYDKNGNVKQVTNKDKSTLAVLNTSYSSYNELGLVKATTDPMSRTTSFEYDKNGNLSQIDPPNGKVVYNTYDVLNRLKGISYTGDSTTWTLEYDDNSNLHIVTKNSANTTYEYDSLNRVTSVESPPVNGISNTTTYYYNPVDQITSIVNSPSVLASEPIEYLYGITGMNATINGTNNCSIYFMHDDDGRLRKSFKKDNNSNKAFISYQTYDTEGHIIRMWTEDNTGIILCSFTYTYDMNGNRKTESNDMDSTSKSYDYDGINQLLEEKYYDASGNLTNQISYRYDLRGNRTKKITGGTTIYYGYNAANEITWLNSNSAYTHDGNGNLTYDGYTSYTYNARNELIQVQGSTTATYEYNYEGLRTKKSVGSKIEYYYYNSNQLAYITDETNTVKYSFTRDTEGNLLNMTDFTSSPANTYWYLFDAHGNVIGLADKNTARVVSYKYDVWGNITQSSSTVNTGDGVALSDANPFKYSGYQYDSETGFYYLKNRYYSPYLGRFLTRDRSFEDNLYEYCMNNPVNMIDPSGYFPSLNDIKKGFEFMEEVFKQSPGFFRNTQKFPTSFGNRIPDFLNKVVVGEIKNVKYQSLTQQIRGFVEIAKTESNKTFVLVVSQGTRLSKPLVEFIARSGGRIIEVGNGASRAILSTPVVIISKDLLDVFMENTRKQMNLDEKIY